MKTTKTLILFVLVFLAINLEGCGRKDAPKLSEPIKIELDKVVAEMACMPTRALPFVSDQQHNQTCFECDNLVQAGLLTREGSTDSTGNSEGTLPANVRYNLTDIGEGAYVQATGDGPYGSTPRFCFGNPRVYRVTSTFGPVVLGGAKNFGIRYIVQLDNPNPYLFDPRAKLLRIRLPNPAMEGKPVFYPEQNITAVINQNNPNDFYLDGSLQIGPIGQN
jgi:hypothetical protein